MQLIRTCGANASEQLRANPITAALEVLYASMAARGRSPAIEAKQTMRP